MTKKIEGSRFQITLEQLEQKESWETTTETSGTDSSAARMSFFMAIPHPAPPQEGQHPVEGETSPS